MRFRKFGIQAAAVNDALLTEYKKIFPQMKNDADIVGYMIESRLIFRPIQNVEDIEDAKKYASNMFYSSLGEWVDAQLRSDIMDHLSLCKNCKVIGKNGYCPILCAFVNPNQVGCHNMSK